MLGNFLVSPPGERITGDLTTLNTLLLFINLKQELQLGRLIVSSSTFNLITFLFFVCLIGWFFDTGFLCALVVLEFAL